MNEIYTIILEILDFYMKKINIKEAYICCQCMLGYS